MIESAIQFTGCTAVRTIPNVGKLERASRPGLCRSARDDHLFPFGDLYTLSARVLFVCGRALDEWVSHLCQFARTFLLEPGQGREQTDTILVMPVKRGWLQDSVMWFKCPPEGSWPGRGTVSQS